MKSSKLVYSTEQGRICPECEQALEKCSCSKNSIIGDGDVRIMLETKARKGKGVSVISGLPLTDTDLKALAKKLKAQCGTGGAVKNGKIEIQGDNREKLKTLLEKEGYKSKRVGG